MGKTVNIADIKLNFPNEWVLLGNPVMDDSKLNVLGGIPIYHSKDKKEVCYLGKDKTDDFDKITLIYTGNLLENIYQVRQPTRKNDVIGNAKCMTNVVARIDKNSRLEIFNIVEQGSHRSDRYCYNFCPCYNHPTHSRAQRVITCHLHT